MTSLSVIISLFDTDFGLGRVVSVSIRRLISMLIEKGLQRLLSNTLQESTCKRWGGQGKKTFTETDHSDGGDWSEL